MLTSKQEKFCLIYVETSNATYSYRQAYSTKNMADKTVNEKASRLLGLDKIRARIKELRDTVAERCGITIKDLIKELDENRKAALSAENPQAAAATAATMGKAKLLGYLEKVSELEKLQAEKLRRELEESDSSADDEYRNNRRILIVPHDARLQGNG